MKRIYLFSVVTFLLFQLCVEAKTTGQPNIIFIYADDWGYGDLGIHGSSFCQTPNLDRMAAEGTDFQNFSVCNPVCSPSRTAVMTGHFPARHSVHGHFASVESHIKRNMPDWLNPEAEMLPRLMQKAGYVTAHFGKWHLTNTHVSDGPSPTAYGYDEFDCFNISENFHQMSADSTIFKTMDFVERNKDRAFFANVWIHASHTPHYPSEYYMKKYAGLSEQQRVYASIIEEADYRIGLLFAKLKALGIDDKTLVMFSSDNGPEITGSAGKKMFDDNSTGPGYSTYYSVGETGGLKGRKRSLYAGGVRIPFIVRWPGVVPAGRVDKVTALATVDILPTCVELSGADMPKGYVPDGESIVKAMKGKSFEREQTIYWQWLFPAVSAAHWQTAAIQEDNWKFMINSKTGRRELYNISADWAEQVNIIDQNEAKARVLEGMIKEWEEMLPKSAPSNCFSKERMSLK